MRDYYRYLWLLVIIAGALSGVGEILFTPRRELAWGWVTAIDWDTAIGVVDAKHFYRGAGAMLLALAIPAIWRGCSLRKLIFWLGALGFFWQTRNLFYHSIIVMRPLYEDYSFWMLLQMTAYFAFGWWAQDRSY